MLAALAVAGAFHSLHAQKPMLESPRTVLKLNPFSLLVATGNFQVEHRLGDRFSAQLGFVIGGPSVSVNAPNLPKPINYTLVGLTPELRYYIAFHKRQVPRGVYLGTYLRLQHVRKRYEVNAYDPDRFQNVTVQADIKINAFGGGFVVGYQFFFKERFGLDLFIGPKYGHALSKYALQCPTCDGDERAVSKPGMTFDGLDLRAGVGFGYGFN